ncbi:hypothetical protein EV702DRAFT_667280 [Suillus placidus]|uniref:Uncharacterized protein n=1 Tax=Suillus placidus TaxID=48579 RepID=A0A9P7CXF4_9AGAM|nr:hypothetical protein EV702DRAFT_667280 [Suillus placidus]
MSDYRWDWPESYPDGTVQSGFTAAASHPSQLQYVSTLDQAATTGSISESIRGNYGDYDPSNSYPTGSSVTYYPNDNSVVLGANYPSSSQSINSAHHPGPSSSSIIHDLNIQGGRNFPTQPSVQSFHSYQPNVQQDLMQPPLGSVSHGHYQSFSSNTSYGNSVAQWQVPSLGIGHELPTPADESAAASDFFDVSKLTRGVRPLISKHKHRASKCKTLLSSKCAPSELISNLLALPTPKASPELVRDVKEGAVINMMQNLFQENLYPDEEDLTRLAMQAIDDTVNMYPQSKVELELWKLTSDVKALRSRLKGTIKLIHGDFRSIAEAIILPAYHLSLNTSGSMNKTRMLASRVAFIGSLLLNDIFADMFKQLQSPDGTFQTIRTPFGNPSLLYLLEYAVDDLQYSRYLCLNAPGWEPRLKNTIYLASVSCGSALLKRYRGQTTQFASDESDWYKCFTD